MQIRHMKELTPEERSRLEAIGKRLKELRLAKGYGSYDEFAWDNGLTKSTYLNMEQGKRNYTMTSLMEVLDVHGLGLSEFFQSVKF